MAPKLTAELEIEPAPRGRWLEQAYLAYKDDLLTAVMCLLGGQRQTAEDVLHDVFAALAKQARPVIAANERNYLITACLNRARDVLRHRGVRSSARDRLGAEICEQVDPAQSAESKEEGRRAFAALANLSPEQREVVAMHLYGELTFREIAETLDLSINTVQSRYRRALSALRKSLTGCSQ